MSKKAIQSLIIILIVGVVIFIIYDFANSQKEKQNAEKKIEQAEDELNQGNDKQNATENPNPQKFGMSDDVPDEYVETESGEKVQYGAAKGDMVYDYELKDIETGEIVKISDFRGQPVFLNFWASWCPPCKQEAPHLQEFSESQDEVVVLGVNVQDAEHEEGAEKEFIDEYGITFTNTYAPDELYYTFPIASFPTSILINSEGVIEEGIVGPLDKQTLQSRFDKID